MRPLRTNNSLEQFNGEIKKDQGVRIFPNRASSLRLVTAVCIEESEEPVTGRGHVNKEALEESVSGEGKEEEKITDELVDELQWEVVYS